MFRPLFAALAAVLIVTGCSAGESPNTPSPSAPTASDSPTAAAEPIPTPSVVPMQLPTIETRTTSDPQPLEISLHQVSVGEKAMTVTFSATNLSTKGNWQVADYFDDGIGHPLDAERNTVDGVAVIDKVNGVRYLPARDAEGNCMCSVNLLRAYLDAGQKMYFSAVYQAVPPEVTKVDVVIPGAGTFADIPVR
ncbi:MAG: hypothetical protein QM804_01265 [Propionicimonas sp.]